MSATIDEGIDRRLGESRKISSSFSSKSANNIISFLIFIIKPHSINTHLLDPPQSPHPPHRPQHLSIQPQQSSSYPQRMGNLCGKVSQKDNFSSPGRVVGTAPPSTTNPNPTSKIPPINTKKAGSSPRTLGGGGGSKAAAGSNDTADARAKAAEAAEVGSQHLFIYPSL